MMEKSEKRALVIAPQPFFSPRGTPLSVYYRTLVTSELGVKIDLLTYGEGQDVDIPGVRLFRIPRFRSLGNVKVGPSYLKLFLDIFILVRAVELLLRNRYDFVHAHEESIFFCRFLKLIFGFKLVYDMHSSLPQQLTNFKFTRSKILIEIFKKLEDSCLRAADVIITICPDLADYVDRLVLKNGKHLLIENSIFEPVKLKNKASNESQDASWTAINSLKLPNSKHLIVYAGTLEPYQGIDILIRAIPKVLKNMSNVFLVIIGGSPEQIAHYSRLAESLNLNGHYRFTGRVPQNIAKKYCKASSVLMSPRSSGTNTPLKVYEQLASGIPLVATRIYSHTQVLNDDVAILVEPNPDDMAAGVIRALNPDSDGNRIATNAKKLYEEKYSRPIYEEKLRRVLNLLS